tara:strand:+ start:153 stop:329 length:177 start_codon:yes stop_codon:yes gene_type:complete
LTSASRIISAILLILFGGVGGSIFVQMILPFPYGLVAGIVIPIVLIIIAIKMLKSKKI